MRKAVPLVLIVGFAAFLLYMLFGMKPVAEDPPAPISLPAEFGSFKQTAIATGNEGMLSFDRQHKKRVPIKEGVMATYADGDVEVDVWVANGTGPTHANQMFMDMAAAIGTEDPVFSQPKAVNLGEINGYRTEGQEAVNFFFTKAGRVYWLAVRGGNPEDVVMGFIPELLKY